MLSKQGAGFVISGVSRVWQAWRVPRVPLGQGRKNCLAKIGICDLAVSSTYILPPIQPLTAKLHQHIARVSHQRHISYEARETRVPNVKDGIQYSYSLPTHCDCCPTFNAISDLDYVCNSKITLLALVTSPKNRTASCSRHTGKEQGIKHVTMVV